jgi:hypothetical protein
MLQCSPRFGAIQHGLPAENTLFNERGLIVQSYRRVNDKTIYIENVNLTFA